MIDEIRIANPTDQHHPFEDKKAINLAQQIVSDFDPHVISAGNDGLDCYGVSSFQKDKADFAGGLQEEIEAWKVTQLGWVDAAPNAKHYFIMGNHEARLRKYLLKNASALVDLDALKIQNLLEFDKFGIRMAKNNEIVVTVGNNKLVVKHGDIVRKFSAYTAKAELEKEMYQVWGISGHTHRGGSHYATPSRRSFVAWFEGFCLCDMTPPYMKNPNWQQGLVLATVTKDVIHVEPVPFFRIRDKVIARWRDKEYVSQ